MDRKFYVSLEAAKLLKEKGYNNYSTVYDCSVEGDILLNQEPMHGEWAGEKDVYPCPTKAEAIDWLESKGMIVIINEYYIIHEENDCHTLCWGYYIRKNDEYVCRDNSSDYLTRLEAEDAAIIKALELLKKVIWKKIFDSLEEPQEYLISNRYQHVDITYTDLNWGNKGHSTKRGAHNSNTHTKNRKAKRRLNKKHNK